MARTFLKLGMIAALSGLAAVSSGCVPVPLPDNGGQDGGGNQKDNDGDNNGNGNGNNGNDNGNEDKDNDPGDLTPVVLIDVDDNNIDNAFLQPQDAALSGGGRDQSLQNGGVLVGTPGRDVIIGGPGQDTLLGEDGADVIIGGLEAGVMGPNGDRAFGGRGPDAFLWAPGDGSDFFDGGPGYDVLVLAPIAQVEGGRPREILLDAETDLPLANATGSGGFCEVIDASASADAADELGLLGLSHLVRFFARGPADSFAVGDQTEDSGLRVTIHTRTVEFLICTVREGGAIEVLDLRTAPPTVITLDEVAAYVPGIELMVQ